MRRHAPSCRDRMDYSWFGGNLVVTSRRRRRALRMRRMSNTIRRRRTESTARPECCRRNHTFGPPARGGPNAMRGSDRAERVGDHVSAHLGVARLRHAETGCWICFRSLATCGFSVVHPGRPAGPVRGLLRDVRERLVGLRVLPAQVGPHRRRHRAVGGGDAADRALIRRRRRGRRVGGGREDGQEAPAAAVASRPPAPMLYRPRRTAVMRVLVETIEFLLRSAMLIAPKD